MPNNVRAINDGVDFRWQCNETLVNKMQCKRPASWIVLDDVGNDTQFQMCNRCKVLGDQGVTEMPILGVANTSTVEVQLPSPPAAPVETVVDSENTEGTEGESTNGATTDGATTEPTS